MKNYKKHRKPLSEKERAKLIERWENKPSENPEFKGATPREVAMALLKPLGGKGRLKK